MDFVDLLAAIWISQYKTAFVLSFQCCAKQWRKKSTLAKPLRVISKSTAHTLADTFARRGAKKGRKDRRLSIHQTGKRRVVIAMREREGRTLRLKGMSEGEGVVLANENVSRLSTMSADEASHWDALHMGWNVDRVNHSEIYSDHGKHTNMVESFFSRLRNIIQGQHHGVSPHYLHQYANHAAWLEDNRHTDNGTLAHKGPLF
jgi:hypothetical protein